MQQLGVVHLVGWGPMGTQPLRSFVQAYRRHAPGAEHELVVVLNGVAGELEQGSGESARTALLHELEGVKHRLLELPQPVQDLEAYFLIAESLEHDRLCFLNSHSQPAVDGWLERLRGVEREPGVGVVGATASWASQGSHTRCLAGLGGPYAGVYEDRDLMRRVFAPHASLSDHDDGGSGGLAPRVHAAWQLAQELWRFPRFPAPHLRTNAFLLERQLMLRLRGGHATSKTDAYRLESGRRSLTRRIEHSGLRVVVAGRDGIAYESRDWPNSQTFWQGSQDNLIVADNQTRAYEAADFEVRRALSMHAWGRWAAPTGPTRATDAPPSVTAD